MQLDDSDMRLNCAFLQQERVTVCRESHTEIERDSGIHRRRGGGGGGGGRGGRDG